jgi:hypothetical protein
MTRGRCLRASVATIVLAGFAALAVAVAGHVGRESRERGAVALPPPDGWVVRGLVRRGQGDHLRFTVRAQQVRVERTRLGPFRIGVTRELHARGVRLDLLRLGEGPTAGPGLAGERARLGEAALTALHLADVAIRVRTPGGGLLKLRADHCDAGLSTGGVVICRGRVRATDAVRIWSFDELRYDAGTGGTVSARGRSPSSEPPATLGQALRRVAASRLVEQVWPALEG